MRLGDILVARGLVSIENIQRALVKQREAGGRLGENLLALELITKEQLLEVIHETPAIPNTVEETGISLNNLQSLMLKFMSQEQRDTTSQLMSAMKLPFNVVKTLFDDAVEKGYVETRGAKSAGGLADSRYALTGRGRETAADAHTRSLYLGPAPVSIDTYKDQILKQRITNEQLDEAAIRESFEGLIIPDHFLRKIGPAVNSGRTMLLYGPPGNGKTSIATSVSKIFRHIICVPYAVEIDGQIMQVFDESVHERAVDAESAAQLARQSRGLRRDEFDHRWVACRRPTVIVGGELSMEMLDLQFSEDAKFYEAPMHIKALNGTFIIDDFGRQLLSPEDLLNRWIVPMESRVDYFKLHTGKSFSIPFDELLIFSTNLAPDDLMDPAFLRRIPYKIELFAPSRDEYRSIFDAVAEQNGLELNDEIFDFIVDQLQVTNKIHLAFYQPRFIVDQVINDCKYMGVQPEFSREGIVQALQNLYVNITIDETPEEAKEDVANPTDEPVLPKRQPVSAPDWSKARTL